MHETRTMQRNVFSERSGRVDDKLFIRGINTYTMKYRILVEADEDGVFVAECPTLPGCVSQGKTRAEALKNVKDAIQGYLASLKKHNEPIPPSVYEEVVEINA